MKNAWTHIQTYDVYVDFEKELYRFPDEVNTTVDMRLTFCTNDRTCYYQILIRTDEGWDEEIHKASAGWEFALQMLGSEVEIPEELL